MVRTDRGPEPRENIGKDVVTENRDSLKEISPMLFRTKNYSRVRKSIP